MGLEVLIHMLALFICLTIVLSVSFILLIISLCYVAARADKWSERYWKLMNEKQEEEDENER